MGCGSSKAYMLEVAAPGKEGGGGTDGGGVLPIDWLQSDGILDMAERNFVPGKIIGKGKFGTVALSKCRESSLFVAIKFVPKEIVYTSKSADRIKNEFLQSVSLNHPFIAQAFGYYETECCYSLVLQYAAGGELYTRMKSQAKMTENCAKFYIGQIALVLKYLHDKRIVYRDLKPENLLIDHCGYLKLCDFGFAAIVDMDEFSDAGTLSDFCGTAMYVAPEIVGSTTHHKHSTPVDWWSLGVVAFEMITGKAPFGDSENMSKFEIFNNINGKSVSFPLSSSSEAKDLIGGLLHKDPLQRFTWKDIKTSLWFSDMKWDMLLAKRIIAPWTPSLKVAADTSNFLSWPDAEIPNKAPTREAAQYCDRLLPQSMVRPRRSSSADVGDTRLLRQPSVNRVSQQNMLGASSSPQSALRKSPSKAKILAGDAASLDASHGSKGTMKRINSTRTHLS